MAATFFALLLCASVARSSSQQLTAAPSNYTVLHDVDFFGYNVRGKKTTTFAACAQTCWDFPDCVAVSWNGPGSAIADSNCNMHCSTAGKRADTGETAAVIRAGKASCPPPPPPRPGPPPPPPGPGPAVPIPAAWVRREREAQMYIAEQQPLVVGNGYVAAMTRTGVMHLAGVFNGDLDKQPVDPTHVSGKEPQRADLPSFWDGFVIESYGGDFASALDVGVSAVYSVGALPGGGSLEARRYAHRSMP